MKGSADPRIIGSLIILAATLFIATGGLQGSFTNYGDNQLYPGGSDSMTCETEKYDGHSVKYESCSTQTTDLHLAGETVFVSEYSQTKTEVYKRMLRTYMNNNYPEIADYSTGCDDRGSEVVFCYDTAEKTQEAADKLNADAGYADFTEGRLQRVVYDKQLSDKVEKSLPDKTSCEVTVVNDSPDNTGSQTTTYTGDVVTDINGGAINIGCKTDVQYDITKVKNAALYTGVFVEESSSSSEPTNGEDEQTSDGTEEPDETTEEETDQAPQQTFLDKFLAGFFKIFGFLG